jgi:hypothetical protein
VIIWFQVLLSNSIAPLHQAERGDLLQRQEPVGGDDVRAPEGRAVQVYSINFRIDSSYGFSA